MTLPNNSSMTAAQGNLPAASGGLSTALAKTQAFYLSELTASFSKSELVIDAEQRACIVSAISAMMAECKKQGITVKEVDQSNLLGILGQIALLRINLTAVPAQGYIIIRNKKQGDAWTKVFEFSIMSDGHDALARKFGVGVKKIYPFWAVREGDDFTYPAFTGIEISPPTWAPKGYAGKVLRVVYPVEYEDGSVVYYIAERDGVTANLQAHIINNTKMSKDLTNKQKDEIRDKIAGMDIAAMLSDPTLAGYISPAYKDPHSREAMIVRKMRNNALKQIPLDFGSAYTADAYREADDEYFQATAPSPEDALEADFEIKAGKEPPQISATSSMLTASQAVGKPQPEEIPAATQTPQEKPKNRPF